MKRPIFLGWISLIATYMLLACSNEVDSPPAAESVFEFKVGSVAGKPIPAIVSQVAKGRSVSALAYWQDSVGSNMCVQILPDSGEHKLRVLVVSQLPGEAWTVRHRLLDHLPDCTNPQLMADLMNLKPEDVDQDNCGEIWLRYQLSCGNDRYDKLLVLEDGKYGLRQLLGEGQTSDFPPKEAGLEAEATRRW